MCCTWLVVLLAKSCSYIKAEFGPHKAAGHWYSVYSVVALLFLLERSQSEVTFSGVSRASPTVVRCLASAEILEEERGAVPPRLLPPSTPAGSAHCATLRKPGALGQLDAATHIIRAREGSEHSYTMAPAPWCVIVMDGDLNALHPAPTAVCNKPVLHTESFGTRDIIPNPESAESEQPPAMCATQHLQQVQL
ncbi:hypothetical protein Anapl_08162 [Anas platyrhynchos]|uniref:Uncharacterized protein n=1 Tax=Anas platyrhynchos TaxID=8839 RepID=R0LVI4_ANAPL|nr:hypothetical protein Anapl_08162 [Anas platyrhynchos]